MRKSKSGALAAFLLLLVLGASFAQWEKPVGIEDYFNPTTSGPLAPKNTARIWFPLAMAAVGICLFTNVLIYMFGYVMHLPRWQAFAASEFMQVTVSALIIVSFVYLVEGGFDYIQGNVLPSGSKVSCGGLGPQDIYTQFSYGPIGAVMCRLQDKITYCNDLYQKIYSANKNVEVKTTMEISVNNMQTYVGDWFTYLHDTMEKAHYLAHQVVPLTIGLVGQYMFLDYIAKNMFTVILPLGIILRIIPIFRGIGGLLIAIGIGFYIIYPLFFLLLDPATMVAPPSAAGGPEPPPKKCYRGFSGMTSAMADVSNIRLDPTGGSGGTTTASIDSLAGEMGKLKVETIFIPMAALVGTLTFIQAAAPFFGGDSGDIVRLVAKVI